MGFKVWRLEIHIQHCSTHSLHELPISTGSYLSPAVAEAQVTANDHVQHLTPRRDALGYGFAKSRSSLERKSWVTTDLETSFCIIIHLKIGICMVLRHFEPYNCIKYPSGSRTWALAAHTDTSFPPGKGLRRWLAAKKQAEIRSFDMFASSNKC